MKPKLTRSPLRPGAPLTAAGAVPDAGNARPTHSSVWADRLRPDQPRAEPADRARTLEQINNQITAPERGADADQSGPQPGEPAIIPRSRRFSRTSNAPAASWARRRTSPSTSRTSTRCSSRNTATSLMSATDQQLIADALSRWRTRSAACRTPCACRRASSAISTPTAPRCPRWSARARGRPARFRPTQAGNQLLALQSQQLSDLIAVISANGRAERPDRSRNARRRRTGREQRAAS